MPIALPEGWYLDGIPLDTLGRVIETRDGWDDTPGTRGENTTLLGRHGDLWRRKKYGPGRKTITVGVHGCLDTSFTIPADGTDQREMYERYLDDLIRLISPRHRLIEAQRVHPDGTRHRAYCEVINPITPAAAGNTYGRVQFELNIPGSFFEDADEQTYRLAYDLAGAEEQALEVFSLAGQTAPCSDAVVTVHGACSTVTVVDEVSGSGFTYDDGLTGSESLVVDAGAFSADVGVVSVLTDLTLFDGQLLEVAPAPTRVRGPRLVVTAQDTDSTFAVTLVTRRKWLR